MNHKTILVSCLFLMVTIVPAAGQAPAAANPRIVFLKGNDVLTASQDGLDARVVTKDGVAKASPRWSPDRRKIMYRVKGQQTADPATHAELIVVTADGRRLRGIQVLATESDGTVVGGLRFIEDSGWLGNDALYVQGSINPRLAEYRVLDADTGHVVGGYLGTGFVTCGTGRKVAYITSENGESGVGKSRVEVNGAAIYAAPDGPSLIDQLQWSHDCSRLAFLETSGTGGRLIVIRGAVIEARLPLSAQMLASLTINSDQRSFLLQSAKDPLYYDVVTRSLRTRPDIVSKFARTKTKRDNILKSLGGRSADGWIDSQLRR